jgi:hypothetical protein
LNDQRPFFSFYLPDIPAPPETTEVNAAIIIPHSFNLLHLSTIAQSRNLNIVFGSHFQSNLLSIGQAARKFGRHQAYKPEQKHHHQASLKWDFTGPLSSNHSYTHKRLFGTTSLVSSYRSRLEPKSTELTYDYDTWHLPPQPHRVTHNSNNNNYTPAYRNHSHRNQRYRNSFDYSREDNAQDPGYPINIKRMEVTRLNFKETLPLVKDAIDGCDFISIDTELSGRILTHFSLLYQRHCLLYLS